MWNGKKKAVTFSFDDGVIQDIRLIPILNKYHLKGTFNLNSALLGYPDVGPDGVVRYNKVDPDQVKEIYNGHEVAVHTLTHPNLTQQSDEQVIRQVDGDRRLLERMVGYSIVGMAYPCGGVNNDARVAAVIKNNTPIRYARTITSTYSYETQKDNLIQFNPTIHYLDERVDEIVEKFLALQTDKEQLLYIWGHSYELDWEEGRWLQFEKLCEKLSGKADIFYGTNKETLL